jgi:NADH-quinone oxidoreductase subunit C
MTSIWIEAQTLENVALFLKNDNEYKVDWLENLSVVEFEGVFVVSYFIRSTTTPFRCVIRASAVPSSPQAPVPFPSIREIWPMGTPMEEEAEELFGIQFSKHPPNLLPEGWTGFPLRKNYVFPREFFGITHSRPFNRSHQKKPS